MSEPVVIWLWVSCAVACVIDFLKGLEPNERSLTTKILGSIIVAIIGPLLFPAFAFAHILKLMERK